jgi:hypothetical protein
VTYFLVYVSSASTLFSRADLDEILRTSRRNNDRLEVSGALAYRGGNLMQVLEGDEATVRTLYGRIEQDPRHRGLIVLLEGEQETRQFPAWSMAFRDLDEAPKEPGFSDFLNTPLTSTEFGTDPSLTQKLLLSFKRSLARG